MAKVVIYTSQNCPYCRQAEALLDKKSVAYEEIRVDNNPDELAKMMEITGRRTVPQIIIDDNPIGGSDDLHELERSGKLDGLLGI